MNEFQQKLWNDLTSLTKNTECFYSVDHTLDHTTYRVFAYRLASHKDFLASNALECRGHMFEIDQDHNPIRLAAMPPSKFFNLYENEFTMNLDLTQVDEVFIKADGSLMSTFIHNNQLKLKSKTSLSSNHAISAMKWLKTQPMFEQRLFDLTSQGWTVNLEWCTNDPYQRIVLDYSQPHLIVLNARHIIDGSYMKYDILRFYFGSPFVIGKENVYDPISFIDQIPSMTNIEGFVVSLKDGTKFKIKTTWYLERHRSRDSINNPRALFEAIINEVVDDLRAMFYKDVVAIKRIDEMQEKVDQIFNHTVSTVEKYYETNKHLTRKEYAILGQQLLDNNMFSLAMDKYIGRNANYKEWMKKHWKEFGIREVVQSE